jgi:hypothetical protein
VGARSLVNIGLDGQQLGSLPSLISLFRIIRRTLRAIRRHGVNPQFRLFTDTSSGVGNIQPRHGSDSSRMVSNITLEVLKQEHGDVLIREWRYSKDRRTLS